MPGTIQVSVLEIVGLQSSSPISQMSIKVAMGKKEYGTSVKEDFSFPLTSLRDNLIIKFLDAEGREISQTGVETRLIVEKGLWDDTFALEGGGHVHMKLRFLLSAEERDQVRAMRHTALKRKQSGLMISNLSSPEISTNASSKISPSSSFKEEVSDSQKSLLQSEAVVSHMVSSKSSDSFFKNAKSVIKDTEGARLTSEDLKKEKLSTSAKSPEKLKNQIPLINPVAKAVFGSSKSVDKPPQHNLALSKPKEKPGPQGKAPSSVRNMISVFESNPVEFNEFDLKQNVKKPRMKPPPIKMKPIEDTMNSKLHEPDSQTKATTTDFKNELKVMRKENYTNEDNISSEDQIRVSTIEAATVSELREPDSQTTTAPTDFKNELKVIHKENYTKEENITSSEAASVSKLCALESQTTATSTNLKNELKLISKENYINEENISSEDQSRSYTSETASFSGRIITDEHLSREQNYDDNLARIEKESYPKDLHEVNSEGVLREKRWEEKNDTVKSELRELDTQTTDLKNELKVIHKETYMNEDNKSEDPIRECPSISGRIMLDEHLIRDVTNTENYGDNLVRDGQGVLRVEGWEDKNDSLDWIFPNNSSRLCITTAGKQMMQIIESLCAEGTTPNPENEEEVNKNEEYSQNPPKNTPDDENSRDPFRQVVRVAIMVGFAALVLFTRERRNRQWSPSEPNAFASCSVDKTIAIWDTCVEKSPLASFKAHDADVNVIEDPACSTPPLYSCEQNTLS
ncbi:hypothetical protein ACFE04_018955 [Oxalis oulophora]